MGNVLYEGSLYDFDDDAVEESMAKEIELALNELRVDEGIDKLPLPPGPDAPNPYPDDLKNRRMLFVAIARGVIRHLVKNQQAFKITVEIENHPDVETYPVIQLPPFPP